MVEVWYLSILFVITKYILNSFETKCQYHVGFVCKLESMGWQKEGLKGAKMTGGNRRYENKEVVITSVARIYCVNHYEWLSWMRN